MKVQTAFRLEKELVEALKDQARQHKRSLNNYVELILSRMVDKKPNDETIQAIEDALEDRNVRPVKNVDDFLKSI